MILMTRLNVIIICKGTAAARAVHKTEMLNMMMKYGT